MAIWAYPFVSVNKDRAYGPADFMQFYANIFSTGIVPNTALPGYTGFQVLQTDTPSLNINVGSGVAIIAGGQIMNTVPKAFQIPAPLTTQSRTDSLVIQWNNSTRAGDIIYKENSTQVVQTADVYELQIATIKVPANAASVSQANITDTRADPEVCGYSSPFEAIKTGDLLAQFKSELESNGTLFESWFDNLQNQLDDNQAANLQNQINKSIHDAGEIRPETDLDNFDIPGFYFASDMVPGTTISNVPPQIEDNFSGQVIVYKNENSPMIRQVVLDNITGKEYQRSYSSDSGAWSSWNEVVMSADGFVSIENLKVSGKVEYPVEKGTLKSDNMPGISIYKDGNTVTIRLVGALSSKVSNGDLIGSIPSGFRPDAEWHFYCFGAGQQYRLMVRPDGGLQASQDIPSGTSFRDTIDYII